MYPVNNSSASRAKQEIRQNSAKSDSLIDKIMGVFTSRSAAPKSAAGPRNSRIIMPSDIANYKPTLDKRPEAQKPEEQEDDALFTAEANVAKKEVTAAKAEAKAAQQIVQQNKPYEILAALEEINKKI